MRSPVVCTCALRVLVSSCQCVCVMLLREARCFSTHTAPLAHVSVCVSVCLCLSVCVCLCLSVLALLQDEHPFEGDMGNGDQLLQWAKEECT